MDQELRSLKNSNCLNDELLKLAGDLLYSVI